MRVDVHFYSAAPMDDPGHSGPATVDRRYTNDDVLACYSNMEHWARRADRLGFSCLWLTEHHFQHEGYEVVPNLILFGTHLAHLTERIKFGQAFNVVPQWHPLRLAEDFAMADHLTGGRMEFGVGRGTVPREAETLGTVVASGDNEMAAVKDSLNREVFEEAMEVIKAAWTQERFSYTGKHFVYPPPGIPDRGKVVTDLTLVPRPTRPIDVYQPVTSPPTLDYVARVGHIGILTQNPPDVVGARWDELAERAADYGRELAPGEERAYHTNVHVGRTTQEALDRVRDPHDELVKFLSPYGRYKHYRGGEVPFDFMPSVEETSEGEHMAIGSVEQVADLLGRLRDRLDLRHLLLFLDFPGLDRAQVDEQMDLLASEVLPRIGVNLPQADA